MSNQSQIAQWEQHLLTMEPTVALKLVGTAIANRIAMENFKEAGALMHIQNRIQRAVDEFKSGYKEY